jgi:hypothetical protein
LHDVVMRKRRNQQLSTELEKLKTAVLRLREKERVLDFATQVQKIANDERGATTDRSQWHVGDEDKSLTEQALPRLKDAVAKARRDFSDAAADAEGDLMCVRLRSPVVSPPRDPKAANASASPAPSSDDDSPIVDAVVDAVQKLESRGHFGPFAAVLGHQLFRDATRPTSGSLVLPSDRFVPFLNGGPLNRSSTLPDTQGLIIALGGAPVELVLGHDMDVQCLQVNLEPRYVLRVYERFVLRIKELDAVCKIVKGVPCLDHAFQPRKGSS